MEIKQIHHVYEPNQTPEPAREPIQEKVEYEWRLHKVTFSGYDAGIIQVRWRSNIAPNTEWSDWQNHHGLITNPNSVSFGKWNTWSIKSIPGLKSKNCGCSLVGIYD